MRHADRIDRRGSDYFTNTNKVELLTRIFREKQDLNQSINWENYCKSIQ